jgi:energy-coupling factor transporter ATP-binding protein EcfA2
MTHSQLRRLKINRYEQFVDVPWIEFSPHENLILGHNGSGKTQLLRLLAAVLSFDYRAYLGAELDVEFELCYPNEQAGRGVVTTRGRVTCTPASEGSEGSEDAANFTARLEIRRDNAVALAQIDGPNASVRVNDVEISETWSVIPGRPLPVGKGRGSDAFGRFRPMMEALTVSPDDREFIRLTARAQYELGATGYPGRFDPDIGAEFFVILDLMHARAELDSRARDVGLCLQRDTRLAPFGSINQQPLHGLFDPLDASALTVQPRVVAEGPSAVECQGVELRVRFNSGLEVADADLTFGQRRFLLIALLVLCTANYPILIDEIDNGLHPRMLTAACKLLRGRQSFLATHNKAVVDLPRYESADDLRQRIHVCRRDDAGNQTVDTLDEAAAEAVFARLGDTHVSDALLADGLW